MTDGLRKSHLRKAHQVGLSEVGLPEGNHWNTAKAIDSSYSYLKELFKNGALYLFLPPPPPPPPPPPSPVSFSLCNLCVVISVPVRTFTFHFFDSFIDFVFDCLTNFTVMFWWRTERVWNVNKAEIHLDICKTSNIKKKLEIGNEFFSFCCINIPVFFFCT